MSEREAVSRLRLDVLSTLIERLQDKPRRVVYRPADLEQWLQSRTTSDTSDADARFLKALTTAHPR
jgi:hypothetical protein